MQKGISLILIILIISCRQAVDQPNYGGLTPVKNYGKWGYINETGNLKIPVQFEAARYFSEGLAAVRLDGMWGFIDTLGHIVIEPEFVQVNDFSDGLSKVVSNPSKREEKAYIDKSGKIQFYTTYERQEDFADGLALIRQNNKISFINKKGEVVLNTDYPYGSGFSGGIAHLWTGDTTVYIDQSGYEIYKIPGMGNGDFSEGLAFVRSSAGRGFIDNKGKLHFRDIPISYYSEFSEGMSLFMPLPGSTKNGFVDRQGKVSVYPEYEELRSFHEGLAAFYADSAYGFMNMKGETVIPPKYDMVGYDGFRNGLCEVRIGRKHFLINHQDEVIWKEEVDILYKEIAIDQWDVDSLFTEKPFFSGKYGGYYNVGAYADFSEPSRFSITIDTTELTVYEDRILEGAPPLLAHKIRLFNNTKDTVMLELQDGFFELILEAINESGHWKPVENQIYSFCGNSYYEIAFPPGFYKNVAGPIYTGGYKTRLRYKFMIGDDTYYSNTISGNINEGQFDVF